MEQVQMGQDKKLAEAEDITQGTGVILVVENV